MHKIESLKDVSDGTLGGISGGRPVSNETLGIFLKATLAEFLKKKTIKRFLIESIKKFQEVGCFWLLSAVYHELFVSVKLNKTCLYNSTWLGNLCGELCVQQASKTPPWRREQNYLKYISSSIWEDITVEISEAFHARFFNRIIEKSMEE